MKPKTTSEKVAAFKEKHRQPRTIKGANETETAFINSFGLGEPEGYHEKLANLWRATAPAELKKQFKETARIYQLSEKALNGAILEGFGVDVKQLINGVK